ncbi:MAG: hypothetical protein ACYC3I_16510 [Gemmataceae bacterium]
MSLAHRCVPLALVVVLLALAAFGSGLARSRANAAKDRDRPWNSDFAKLQRGMTPEQVRQRVGDPKHIARQLLYHRYREQWIYDVALPVRLTFDCPRGQKPQLLSPPELPD